MDVNHKYNTKNCHLVRWEINKSNFKLNNVFRCTEPGRVSAFIDKEKLRIQNTDFGQVITLKRNTQLMDKFKIIDYLSKQVDRYPYEIKELQLMRFDKLSSCKLFNYVDSLIYKVLEYDSTKTDSTYQDILRNTKDNNVKVKIRDGYNPNPEPVIVLNGYIVDDKEILKRFRLVETIEIQALKKDDLKFIYGTRALNGVIVILVSKKRFKKQWKKYGR